MMKIYPFLIILLLFSSCRNDSPHDTLANQAMISFSKELYKEEGLILEGFGGTMMYDIEKFELHFLSRVTGEKVLSKTSVHSALLANATSA